MIKFVLPAAAMVALIVGGRKVIVSEIIKKRAAPYIALINATEQKNGIPPGLLFKLLETESAFDPDVISGKRKSSVGAMGIAQFMPATAREVLGSEAAALNPSLAIPGAGRYLATLRRGKKNWEQAVASYNAGGGTVNNALAKAAKGGGDYKQYLPQQETRDYVAKISSGLSTDIRTV